MVTQRVAICSVFSLFSSYRMSSNDSTTIVLPSRTISVRTVVAFSLWLGCQTPWGSTATATTTSAAAPYSGVSGCTIFFTDSTSVLDTVNNLTEGGRLGLEAVFLIPSFGKGNALLLHVGLDGLCD